jgi:hypothetical protein
VKRSALQAPQADSSSDPFFITMRAPKNDARFDAPLSSNLSALLTKVFSICQKPLTHEALQCRVPTNISIADEEERTCTGI